MKTYKSNTKKFSIKANATDFPKAHIKSSTDSAAFIRQFYNDMEVCESFYILFLNRANNTVGYAKISQGGVAGTVVDPKIIGKYMVDTLACAVILAHNHPSGNLKPSEADKRITKKIQKVGELLDCQVLDHIILTHDAYYSFADECLF